MLQSVEVLSKEIHPVGTLTEQNRSDGRSPGWYAIFTLTRHEKRAATHCGERQIESFVPLYSVKHRWKNRCTVTLELPLFPSYFFVRIDPRERLRIVKIPGVVCIVSAGREPLPVPDQYVAALRAGLLAHRITPHANLEVGDRVRITTGPMAGMEGVLKRQKNELRVILKVEMIACSVSVEVGAEEVEFVGPIFERSRAMASNNLLSPMGGCDC